MNAWLPEATLLLQQAAAALPDTINMRQIASEPTLFDRIASIASIIMTLSLIALAVGLIPAAWNFRKSYKKVNDLLDRVYADITPIVRHTHTTVDNLDYITTAVRTDLQQVSRTVQTANERLLQAVRQSERRLAEFNALLRVMQEEAEGVFVSTAATVRGVRTGARTFGELVEDDLAGDPEEALDLAAGARARMDERLARLEALAAEAADDLTDDLANDHEVDDGDDDDGGALAPGHAEGRPRIRPRRGREA